MTTLGKYELHEQLGRGGFGTVYRATDTTLDRVVALKILHPQLTTDPDFLDRFRKEAKFLASLQSPYIVTVHELAEVDGRIFIAMEYLAGGSLKDRLEKEGHIPFLETKAILDQVCEGLAVAHDLGLVHRDIKPGNILFDTKGRAVIADFGLAKAVQLSSVSSTSSSLSSGTPAYRPPELWRGKPPASPATDVYSLACVTMEMLTGNILFNGDTPDEILTQHLIDGPILPQVFPSGTPRGFESVITKALSRDPLARFPDCRAYISALQSLVSPHPMQTGEPLPARVTSPKEPLNRILDSNVTKQSPPALGSSATSKKKGKSPAFWIGLSSFAIVAIILVIVLISDDPIKDPYSEVSNPTAIPVKSLTDTPVVSIDPTIADIPDNDPTRDVDPTPDYSLSLTQTAIAYQFMELTRAAIKPTDIPPSAGKFYVCREKCNPDGSNSIFRTPAYTSKVYFRFVYENIPQGAHVIRRWTSNGEEWIRYDCYWDLPSSGVFENPMYDKSLRSGTWDYEMYVEDQLILYGSFLVEGDDTYFAPQGLITGRCR